MTSGSRRPTPGGPWPTAGRARPWGLIGLLLGLVLSACTAAAAPPPTTGPVSIIVGTVTASVRWYRPGQPYLMITYHDGPGVVGLRETTPIWLHTVGQLPALAPVAIQVGDQLTVRVA